MHPYLLLLAFVPLKASLTLLDMSDRLHDSSMCREYDGAQEFMERLAEGHLNDALNMKKLLLIDLQIKKEY